MKKLIHVVGTALPLALTLALVSSGCSTISGGSKSAESLSQTGPTVVQAKPQPSTFKLDNSLRPETPAQVFADVKDFTSNVQSVRLRFLHVPLELKMQKLSGTTWQATIPSQTLQKLAVSGQTIKYKAQVIAQDANGNVATSKSPIDIAVQAPKASQLQG